MKFSDENVLECLPPGVSFVFLLLDLGSFDLVWDLKVDLKFKLF